MTYFEWFSIQFVFFSNLYMSAVLSRIWRIYSECFYLLYFFFIFFSARAEAIFWVRCPPPVHYCYTSTTCPPAPLMQLYCILSQFCLKLLVDWEYSLRQSYSLSFAPLCCIDVLYSKSIIKQGGNGGYTYEKFSMGQVVGIVNARW